MSDEAREWLVTMTPYAREFVLRSCHVRRNADVSTQVERRLRAMEEYGEEESCEGWWRVWKMYQGRTGKDTARLLPRAVRVRAEFLRAMAEGWDQDLELIACGLSTEKLDTFLKEFDPYGVQDERGLRAKTMSYLRSLRAEVDVRDKYWWEDADASPIRNVDVRDLTGGGRGKGYGGAGSSSSGGGGGG